MPPRTNPAVRGTPRGSTQQQKTAAARAALFGKLKRPLQQAAYTMGVWRPRNTGPRARIVEWNATKGAWAPRGFSTNSAWYKEQQQLARRLKQREALFGKAKRAVQQATYSMGVWRPRPNQTRVVELGYNPSLGRWVPIGMETQKTNYYQSKNYKEQRKRSQNLAKRVKRGNFNNTGRPARRQDSAPRSWARSLTPPSLRRLMGRRSTM